MSDISNNIKTAFISIVFLLIAFFLLAIIGAGSHGHFGLHDHSDSYEFYIFIFYCFMGIVGINHLNSSNKLKKSKKLKILYIALYGLYILTAIFLLIFTIIEDITTFDRDRIFYKHYLMIITPILLLLLGLRKLLVSKNKNNKQEAL